jgi:hemerythrin-like domain-containing protein
MNAIQLLKEDHKKVRKLLSELADTTPRGVKSRTELLEKIATELRVHAKIEEEIFYPALRAAAKTHEDQTMYFEALEEHRAAGELVLPDLEKTDPSSECFGGRAKVLKELVEHHAGEEEKEMFPRARELLSAEELKELGARMEQRKQELLAGDEAGFVGRAAGKLVDALALDDDGAAATGVPPLRRNGRGNHGAESSRSR